MRLFLMISVLILALSESSAALAQDRADFEASFGEISINGEGCDEIFAVQNYYAKYFLVGPTGRTLVNNLTSANNEAFFDGMTFVTNYGYDNDYIFEKTFEKSGDTYELRAEGFVTVNVSYGEYLVSKNDGECTAYAVLSGFN